MIYYSDTLSAISFCDIVIVKSVIHIFPISMITVVMGCEGNQLLSPNIAYKCDRYVTCQPLSPRNGCFALTKQSINLLDIYIVVKLIQY